MLYGNFNCSFHNTHGKIQLCVNARKIRAAFCRAVFGIDCHASHIVYRALTGNLYVYLAVLCPVCALGKADLNGFGSVFIDYRTVDRVILLCNAVISVGISQRNKEHCVAV